jgi:nitrogen fixation protein FixH
MRTDYNPAGRPFTGRAMLKVILGFFGVIVAVNLVMAVLAVNSFRGVVVQSGYVASQDFNRDQARLAAQAARGWGVSVDAPGGAPRATLTRADGAPLAGLTVAGSASRPADGRTETALAFAETAPGVYAADGTLAPGQWRLVLTADGEGPRHASVHRLLVRAE